LACAGEAAHRKKEKPTKKFVGRKGQAAQKKGKKHHPIAAWGLGDAIGAGEDDLITSDKKSILLGLGQIGLFELRWQPAGRRIGDLLLPHLVLMGKTFDTHLQKLHLVAVKELGSAKEMQQWWRWEDNELVNRNNPTIPFIKLPDKGTWAETWRKKRKW
jgi:hypothetical protein